MGSKPLSIEEHDILLIGVGISGINTAHVLQQQLPHRSFAVLEGRSVVGGTWSFFRYLGSRSDLYTTTFGLGWHPWSHEHKIASGPGIARYLEDAVDKIGLRDQIRFRHKVTDCHWRSEEERRTLKVDVDGVHKTFKANCVLGSTGYYFYGRALETVIPGLGDFQGRTVHPQWWPEDLE